MRGRASNRPSGSTPAPATIPLDAIRVGKRHRRDLGDIDALAGSIADVGLLQPIALTFDGYLIAGERRLRAVERLGWKTIPYTLIPINLDQIVRGEFAENTQRKDFTFSEAVAIKAKERIASPENFSEQAKGNALDKVAAVVGKHRTTIAKAEAVVTAAEAEPEKFGKLREDMDRTGRVDGPYRRLKNAQQAEQIRAEPPPLPGNGPYRVAVCDVPWPYEHDDEDPSDPGVRPYPTMSIADIRALPISSLMHEDSILWFWTTDFHMHEAFKALELGFERKKTLTWVKDRIGYGQWLRSQTEHCIMAVRGKPVVTLTNQTTALHALVRGDSVKPKEFYDFIESLCPAPRYADLFSRYQHNDKWDCHGDEAPKPQQREAAE